MYTISQKFFIEVTESDKYFLELDDKKYRDKRPFPYAFLVGDSAFKVHFWPGRGLNSAIKGSVALSRRIYWMTHSEDTREFDLYFNPVDNIPIFTSFMNGLKDREQTFRSKEIVRESISNAFNNLSFDHEKNVKYLIKKSQTFQNNLKNRLNWNDEMIVNDILFIENRLRSLKNETVALLKSSKPWPTKEMAGNEILPVKMCKDPFSDEFMDIS